MERIQHKRSFSWLKRLSSWLFREPECKHFRNTQRNPPIHLLEIVAMAELAIERARTYIELNRAAVWLKQIEEWDFDNWERLMNLYHDREVRLTRAMGRQDCVVSNCN